MPKTSVQHPHTLPPNLGNSELPDSADADEPDTNSISIELVDNVFYLVNQEEDTICLGKSKYIDDVLDELKVYLEAMTINP